MRPIHISLSPNLEKDEVVLALKLLGGMKATGQVKKMEQWWKDYFGPGKYVISFNAGRTALWAILKAVEIKPGDEVIVQAFTCVAVTNSVKWSGAKPVFADIEEDSFNMDPVSLEKKLTTKTKAVVVQHTFGNPAKLSEIEKICQKHKVMMIEDCAHALGARDGKKLVGSIGKVAFFSLGRDKVVSSVFGGVVVTGDQLLAEKIKSVWDEIPSPSEAWVRQQLWHPVISWVVLWTYNFGSVGKVILKIAQKLKWVSLAVYPEEKKGKKPDFFPSKYADRLAVLAISQLNKLARFNQRRQYIANKYRVNLGVKGMVSGSICLRFPVLVDNPVKMLSLAKSMGWVWGDWYKRVVEPAVNSEVTGYIPGSCPIAEKVCNKVLNLPTCPYLSDNQVDLVIEKFKLWSK